MWECDYERELQSNGSMRSFVDSLCIVTSFYPFVNKAEKIPLGHPKIITENFGGINSYEGLIKYSYST
jgi:hypothetical protein